jgi:hypothetical protein
MDVGNLWAATPPVDPPVDPPDPPPVTGAIETGSSYTYPTRITPNLNGHGFTGPGYWQEINRTVVNDAADPASDHLIAKIGARNIHIDFYGTDSTGKQVGLEQMWGIPINVVSGTHAKQSVDLLSYAGESDHVDVPFPANPSIEGWKGPGLPTQADISDGNDHHMLIAQRDEATGGISDLYELYQPYHDSFGWHAAQLSHWNLADGLPRFEGWTSTDAAGLPRIPFMATYGEVHQVGGIQHPLAVTFDVGAIRNRYIWPARHTALNGSNTDGIPFGGRLRLRADWFAAHADEFTGEARVFVEAMRTYGVINADIGGMGFLCGISDDRFDNDNLMTLQNIPWTAFEVVKMTPQFELVGPSIGALGETLSYTVKVNPDPEPNGVHGYYVHSYEAGPIVAGRQTWIQEPLEGVLDWHHLGLDNGVWHFDLKYTPQKAGKHLIEVDQAGEYKMPWTPETQPIPGQGPFPYFEVDVTP